ncbi:MAG: hypothetical protein IT373_33080 [Polyangiaceae bacterium]|nr:hypothetical protein [Polyangiaceae bacterium]
MMACLFTTAERASSGTLGPPRGRGRGRARSFGALALVLLLPCCDDHHRERRPSDTNEAPNTLAPPRPDFTPSRSAGPRPAPPTVRSSDPPADPTGRSVPISVPDAANAELAGVLEQARALALSLDERVGLVTLGVEHMTAAGGVDLTRDMALYASFGFHELDPTKAPGADLVEVGVSITSSASLCGEVPAPCLRGRLQDSSRLELGARPRPLPACSLADAWRAAHASGVPENAVATATYGFWEGPPQLWTFEVAGHGELRRDIDGATCRRATREDVFRAMDGSRGARRR